MENTGNSNRITRRYLDSLLIETRYMNSDNPDTGMTLYGKEFSSPIMTGALSHLDHFMFEGATKALALGATAVGIGRPLMTAIKNDGSAGVRDYLEKARCQLAKAMAFTGCTDLTKMDPTIIHTLYYHSREHAY